MNNILTMQVINHAFNRGIKAERPDFLKTSGKFSGPSVNHLKQCEDKPIHDKSELFFADIKDLGKEALNDLRVEGIKLAKSVTKITLAPFAFLADIFRAALFRSVSLKKTLYNIYYIPKEVIYEVGSMATQVLRIAHKIVSAIGTGTGFLIWHGAEKFSKDKKSILSDNRQIRQIVYRSIGLTALSAIGLCIPVLPIQVVALSILSGSIYGIANNMITNRRCPE